MLKPSIKALLAMSPLLFPASGQAVVFDFNTTNLGVAGGYYNSVGMSAGGIGVTIDSVTLDNDGAGNITAINTISGAGLGIYVSSSSNNLGVKSLDNDGNYLDGGAAGDVTDPDEGMRFIFDQVVSLDYINFDYFGTSDDFNLTVDGTTLLVDFNASDASPLASALIGQLDEYNFAGISGTEFIFWADGDTDGFRIDSMNVSAVPLPATLWLFVSGLAGLVAARRNR